MKKKAYVFIKVAAGKLDGVMRVLSEMPQVISAEGVSGHVDVVAIMRGPDLETLQNTILSTVRGIDGIESTETWIVMVSQPDTWTQDELERYASELTENELTAINVLLEKNRGMMIQELIDAIADKLDDDNYDIHDLTVTLTSMTRKAEDQYRRENVIEFDQDMGYFLNDRYTEPLARILVSRGVKLDMNVAPDGREEESGGIEENDVYGDDKTPL
ncbi:MAG: hypothetical protein CVT63_00285 [Candidatus Anoxymicrobium japonicum]|uniref:Transcription regulator AsnC/Lrp ligand binding domain-containing protein n=1 Tax=Candidatus Anoxymicrobium japonicum TaxID=2013648 RepID=A0A2N3G8I3_9ACTN|nr:MAG: hypothetical protein CVT63_00285 [Candidatus Anoxymicrobium japonicum]